jgi:hypothetical protein
MNKVPETLMESRNPQWKLCLISILLVSESLSDESCAPSMSQPMSQH